MKKLISILLAALILCFGCAAGASAALPAPGAIEAQSLQFELPAVTAIEAQWSGEYLFDSWLDPKFTPENVTVTVYFEEGEPEVLRYWYARTAEWYWHVYYDFDCDAGRVTFTYWDTNLVDVDDADLPQASFDFPADYLARFMASQQVTQLKLGEASTAQGTENGWKIFAFTPATSGDYRFTTDSEDWYGALHLMDADLDRVGFGYVVYPSLQAGKTYYLFVYSYVDGEYSVTVTDYSSNYTLWDAIRSFFAGVGFWLYLSPFFLLMLLYMIPSIIWSWLTWWM
ncbi:MAG: hypothetical protein FWE98_00530 [Oscillospiraceae bacterium]|nr:hypothetical protein [Oscillospiraceae bacterium]